MWHIRFKSILLSKFRTRAWIEHSSIPRSPRVALGDSCRVPSMWYFATTIHWTRTDLLACTTRTHSKVLPRYDRRRGRDARLRHVADGKRFRTDGGDRTVERDSPRCSTKKRGGMVEGKWWSNVSLLCAKFLLHGRDDVHSSSSRASLTSRERKSDEERERERERSYARRSSER